MTENILVMTGSSSPFICLTRPITESSLRSLSTVISQTSPIFSRLSGSGGEEKEDKTNVARYVYIEAILNICIPSDMEWEHSEIPR